MSTTDAFTGAVDGRLTVVPAPLAALTADEREVLASYMQARAFPTGSCIFRAGSPGDGFFVISEGDVRIEVERPGVDSDTLDTDGTLGYSGPGDLLGEVAVLDGQPRSASAFAETDVVLQHVPATALDELLAQEPRIAAALAFALGRDASRMLRKATDRLAEFVVPEGGGPQGGAVVCPGPGAPGGVGGWCGGGGGGAR